MKPAIHDWVPSASQEEFIATVRPNVRFPSDAGFWAERLFGAELTANPESQAVILQAGSEFFAHALAAYAEQGAAYQSLVEDLRRRTGLKGKALFMPLRAALTGETHGPELARVLTLLPPERIRQRLQACC
jgi:glutamyl-tRNA synthetase